MWVWGGCYCDFDFVGVLYGVCKICYSYNNDVNAQETTKEMKYCPP